MPTHDYSGWRKSSRSNDANGNCVELGYDADAKMIGIRDTKEKHDPNRSTLEFPSAAVAGLLDKIKRGEIS